MMGLRMFAAPFYRNLIVKRILHLPNDLLTTMITREILLHLLLQHSTVNVRIYFRR